MYICNLKIRTNKDSVYFMPKFKIQNSFIYDNTIKLRIRLNNIYRLFIDIY